jgi:hypothetical protein
MLVSYLDYSSTLKIEATCSSETSVHFQRTTRRCIPEDRTLQNSHTGNLVNHTGLFFRKVAYSMYDVTPEMFETDNKMYYLQEREAM